MKFKKLKEIIIYLVVTLFLISSFALIGIVGVNLLYHIKYLIDPNTTYNMIVSFETHPFAVGVSLILGIIWIITALVLLVRKK